MDGRQSGIGSGWDETRFEQLFHAHYDGIYRLLYRHTGSRAEAEDLAQETFLRCYRSGAAAAEGRDERPDSSGDGKEPAAEALRAWLYRVAMNLASNARRDRRRRFVRDRRAGEAEEAERAGRAGLDPAETLVRQREREAVREVLASLPDRQERILLLRHSGLRYREIAAILDVSPASIGTLLARAEEAFLHALLSKSGRSAQTAARSSRPKEDRHEV
ncbi:MAG: sigma-70 family RNA polymerase sigma factor [Candidatus Eisenbacteria bacterium]|nr:sigma-70 family RNA polymerase sigma factor [Candidatus Eisenbacteria bacterium]